jgi:adenylate cyclase, class 2
MYEVEVKASLKDRKKMKKKLEDMGCIFSSELHQVDHIFFAVGTPFPPPLGIGSLRVRKQNGRSFLTLKIPQGSRQDCIEREMEIKDGDMMIEILELLKWEKVPIVDKKRIKTNFKDMEIVLDEVKDLGHFIEAEKIVKNESKEDRKKTQEELFTFLESLGVSEKDRVIDGKYDIMLFEKFGKK